MRLRRTLALSVTATATAVLGLTGPVPVAAGASGSPAGRACEAASDGGAFPVTSTIHDGPAEYRTGGAPRQWTLDLTNTTDAACDTLHPVLVLADHRRTLRSGQIRLEFDDGGRWRPVRFEKTGQGDHVGVFDDGFRGFSAGPGRTVTVRVRLGFAPGTDPGHVVAAAALVQRRGDDGAWVGESKDYPFDIVPGPGPAPDGGGDTGGADIGGGDAGDGGAGDPPGRSYTAELAATGPGDTLLGLACTAGGLLLAGAALMTAARRHRTPPCR
ncbi:hypothetical protein [Streptomyces sp. NPDC049813]|uniref:hypothetical protein n=1 Tax=Streptomyces sp. NPDC049813 TaxID=3365597 RepID=UPI003798C3AE